MPVNPISAQLFAATISSSCLTYSAGPIFFEFTAELVYPVPEGIVGGFLTTFYNGVGMVHDFTDFDDQVSK